MLALALMLAAPAEARPVVVEMFTSQACSSCPPADALLQKLAAEPGILALSFNVTYWNGPAWTDTDSLQAATDLQYWYADVGHNSEVYTPEAVVDGAVQLVGSDADNIAAAIAAAKTAPAGDVPINILPGMPLGLTVGRGSGAATVWLYGYDALHQTRIGGGENGGAVITEVNVVRSITRLGAWRGDAESFTIPPVAGGHLAVVLQGKEGAILGAAAR